MDRKLLIVSVGLVIIALVSVPVVAVPVPPFEQIITILTNIQTRVGDIYTKVTSIEEKVQTPPEPVSYEYYADTIRYSFDNHACQVHVTNMDDTDHVYCVYQYVKRGDLDPWELVSEDPSCAHISSHYTVWKLPQFLSPICLYRAKITTDSKYVIPGLQCNTEHAPHDVIYHFPGDFHKVEIYS